MADSTVTYRAAWVLPIATPPVQNGAVAVTNGKIGFVGSFHDAPRTRVVDLGDAVLMPGLVNTHTHLELTAMRNALEGLHFVDWIRTLTRLRKAVLSAPGDIKASARLGIAEGLTRGITTYADTAAIGAPVLEAMRDMQVRGIVYQESFGPDPDVSVVEPAIRRLRQQVAELRGRATDMVRVGVSPHAPYSVSVPLYKAIGLWAAQQNLPVAVHLAESEDEDRLVRKGEGAFADMFRTRGLDPAACRARSPVALLEDAHILRLKPLVIHAVRIDTDDALTLARYGCSIAHCPTSNARFGHGIAPWRLMQDHGLVVGIGTDSVASNNRMDLLDETRTATLMACAREKSPFALTPMTALRLATQGGAQAIGLLQSAGALLPGYHADLCAWGLDALAARPIRDIADSLINGVAGTAARMTMVGGQVLWEDGRHLAAPRLAEDLERIERLGARCMQVRAAA